MFHDDNKRLGSWPNFLRALGALVAEQPAADAFCIFQDDILVCRNLRPWLEGQLWPHPRLGVLSLYCCGKQDGGGWGWCCEPVGQPIRTYSCALAAVLSPEAARGLLQAPPNPGSRTKTDHWLGVFCRQNGLVWVRPVPSLVRHVGRTSAISDKDRWHEWRHERRWVEDVAQLTAGRRGWPACW